MNEDSPDIGTILPDPAPPALKARDLRTIRGTLEDFLDSKPLMATVLGAAAIDSLLTLGAIVAAVGLGVELWKRRIDAGEGRTGPNSETAFVHEVAKPG